MRFGPQFLLAAAFFCGPAVFAQSITVEALINSGEESPTLIVTSPSDIADIESRIIGLPSSPKPRWNALGWRGYLLRAELLPSFPAQVRAFNGVVEVIPFPSATPLYYRDSKRLESKLNQLGTGVFTAALAVPPAESTDATEYTAEAPDATENIFAASALPEFLRRLAGLPLSGSEPKYEPDEWNKAPIQGNNNCYNYSVNVKLPGFGRPGRAGDKNPPRPGEAGYNCENFIKGAEADGLVKSDCDQACPKGSFKVALVLDPTGDPTTTPKTPPDYHWYRQDSNGNWSHKPGGDTVRDVDTAGNKIEDPRKADRRRANRNGRLFAGYSDFCACFCVDPAKVAIK